MKKFTQTMKSTLFSGFFLMGSVAAFAQGNGNGNGGQNGGGNNNEFAYNCTPTINLTMVDGKACIDPNATEINAKIQPNSVRTTATLSFSPSCFNDEDLTWTLVGQVEIDGILYNQYESKNNSTTATLSHPDYTTYTCNNSKVRITKLEKACNLEVSVSAGRTVLYYGANLGYDATTLTATSTGANGSVSYSWSNGATGSPISISATSTDGSTTYTVTATDAAGCTATASIRICSFNVSCGTNKVNMWKLNPINGRCVDNCINFSAVQTQLNNGASFGKCGVSYTCASAVAPLESIENIEISEISLNAFPNPFSGSTNIEFTAVNDEMVTLNIYSLTGQKIKTLANEMVQAGHTTAWNFAPQNGNGNSYIAVLKTSSGINKSIVLVTQ